jgi:hypothetical protein
MSRLKAKFGKSRDVSNGTLIGPNFFSSSALSLRADAHFLPASNFLTTSVYTDCQHDAPGIGFLGKKTWTPGKNLMKFIAATFGIPAREQSIILEAISDSVAETVPLVRDEMAEQPLFRDIGKRLLPARQERITGLRDRRVYAAGTEAAGGHHLQNPLAVRPPVSALRRT